MKLKMEPKILSPSSSLMIQTTLAYFLVSAEQLFSDHTNQPRADVCVQLVPIDTEHDRDYRGA